MTPIIISTGGLTTLKRVGMVRVVREVVCMCCMFMQTNVEFSAAAFRFVGRKWWMGVQIYVGVGIM